MNLHRINYMIFAKEKILKLIKTIAISLNIIIQTLICIVI